MKPLEDVDFRGRHGFCGSPIIAGRLDCLEDMDRLEDVDCLEDVDFLEDWD